jgi:hypothetical protein
MLKTFKLLWTIPDDLNSPIPNGGVARWCMGDAYSAASLNIVLRIKNRYDPYSGVTTPINRACNLYIEGWGTLERREMGACIPPLEVLEILEEVVSENDIRKIRKLLKITGWTNALDAR